MCTHIWVGVFSNRRVYQSVFHYYHEIPGEIYLIKQRHRLNTTAVDSLSLNSVVQTLTRAPLASSHHGGGPLIHSKCTGIQPHNLYPKDIIHTNYFLKIPPLRALVVLGFCSLITLLA